MRPVWMRTIGPGSAVGGILASTAYDGSRIYGSDSADGQIWALDRAGAMRWSSLDPGAAEFSRSRALAASSTASTQQSSWSHEIQRPGSF
jgi:hypothetical protein